MVKSSIFDIAGLNIITQARIPYEIGKSFHTVLKMSYDAIIE